MLHSLSHCGIKHHLLRERVRSRLQSHFVQPRVKNPENPAGPAGQGKGHAILLPVKLLVGKT